MCCVAPLSRSFGPCTPVGLTVPTPSDASRSARDGCAFGMPTSRVTTTTIHPRAKPAGCLRLETKDGAVSLASAGLVMKSPPGLLAYKVINNDNNNNKCVNEISRLRQGGEQIAPLGQCAGDSGIFKMSNALASTAFQCAPGDAHLIMNMMIKSHQIRVVRVALCTEKFLRSQLLLTLHNVCTQNKVFYGMVEYKLAPTPPPFETVLAQVSFI
jgi:hypothetical protein